MLKKIFSTVLVTVATVLMAQSAFAYYNPFDSLSAKAINGYKSLYYSIPNYGVEYEHESSHSGVKGIKFQDLDNDNIPEMIVDYFVYDLVLDGYNDRTGYNYLRIYTIDNDAPLLIYDNIETIGVSGYKGNYFGITYGDDGKTYVVNSSSLREGGVRDTYELLYKEGNAIKRKVYFEVSGEWEYDNYINETKVTLSEFTDEIKKYLNIDELHKSVSYYGSVSYVPICSSRVSFGFTSAADINYMMNAALMKKN